MVPLQISHCSGSSSIQSHEEAESKGPHPPPSCSSGLSPLMVMVLDSHPFHCLCEVIQLSLLTTITTRTTQHTTIVV